MDTEKNMTELQKRALEIVDQYEGLTLQGKIDVIAQAFGCKTGEIRTSPCTGSWRGTSDMSIYFDNGSRLFIGNHLTPKTKTIKIRKEFVDRTLVQYNREIIQAKKKVALPMLLRREIKDNEIAAQKGLKPYTLLDVELCDGSDEQISGYIGWYYVTLVVDGKIFAHLETGLNYDIANGKVSATPSRTDYFIAGALKETEVDYVFNNVGFSSASTLYKLPLREDVWKRAENKLAERSAWNSLFPMKKQLAPDEFLTGERIRTPRGSFLVTDMTKEQMEAVGYGFHHQSDDGKYLIMGNGKIAFAVLSQEGEKR